MSGIDGLGAGRVQQQDVGAVEGPREGDAGGGAKAHDHAKAAAQRPNIGASGMIATAGMQARIEAYQQQQQQSLQANAAADDNDRGFARVGGDERPPVSDADLAERRERAVDEIGRGHIEDGGAFQNFQATLQDIYRSEGSAGVERFRQDIEGRLKANFGDRASLAFEPRTDPDGTRYLEIELVRVADAGHTVKTTGGVVLSKGTD